MARLACALFTNMLLTGSGLKLKQTKGDEVNHKPDQEEEKEVGRGGCCWPAIDQRGENEGEHEDKVDVNLGTELQRSVEQVQT